MNCSEQPTVALMSCGRLYEDFFEPLGVSFEKLRPEQTCGWMFNYIDALKLTGVRVQTVYGISTEKVARIFNPLDVKNWQASSREAVRAELDIPLDAKVVIFHGRIDITHKGLDILLEAWNQVCQTRLKQSLKLLLVGTGKDAPELQRRIDALQVPGVLWINKYVRDRELIRRYLSAADVYTLPSRHEGFPVAPIEAMSCGLPVVVLST